MFYCIFFFFFWFQFWQTFKKQKYFFVYFRFPLVWRSFAFPMKMSAVANLLVFKKQILRNLFHLLSVYNLIVFVKNKKKVQTAYTAFVSRQNGQTNTTL